MRNRVYATAVLAAMTLVSACGRSDDKADGTHISISGKTDKGTDASLNADEDGTVKIDVPGFQAKVNLPRIKLDAQNMDIDGVKLYPGSTVTSVNIIADNKNGADENDKIEIVFDAPADVAKVRTWFTERMKAEKFTVTETPTGLGGTTDDGDPFRLDFTPGAAGHSTGTIAIRG